jgi:hypothetical protein
MRGDYTIKITFFLAGYSKNVGSTILYLISSYHYDPFGLFALTGSREDLQRKGRFRYKPAINKSN